MSTCDTYGLRTNYTVSGKKGTPSDIGRDSFFPDTVYIDNVWLEISGMFFFIFTPGESMQYKRFDNSSRRQRRHVRVAAWRDDKSDRLYSSCSDGSDVLYGARSSSAARAPMSGRRYHLLRQPDDPGLSVRILHQRSVLGQAPNKVTCHMTHVYLINILGIQC